MKYIFISSDDPAMEEQQIDFITVQRKILDHTRGRGAAQNKVRMLHKFGYVPLVSGLIEYRKGVKTI